MTRSRGKTIPTEAGTLELDPVGIDALREAARYWPMEIIATAQLPAAYGLVFQHGAREVYGLKLQPADTAESDAIAFHHLNRSLIAAALPQYLEKGHRGLIVPCAYYKAKPSGMAETGFVFFVGPDPASRADPADPRKAIYDEHLGAGATPMIVDMFSAIGRASQQHELPLMRMIGAQLSPRLAIGGLALYFLVVGGQVIVVKEPVDETDPVWRRLVQVGYSTLPYAPMQPIALPEAPGADLPRP